MNPIIKLENVSFTYLHRKNPVLKNVSLEINPGEFVSLIGPLGAGKSTLLYTLNGVIPHHFPGKLEGKVLVDGLDTRKHSIVDLARHVGLVVEDPQIQIFNITVEDDVAFGPINLNLPEEEIGERVEYALEVLRLKELRKRHPRELSGGQQQRVALAGVLAMRPKLIALDEPISMLDPIGKSEVLAAIKELNQKYGIACLISESGSDIEQVIELATRVVVINDGQIILDSEVHEALKDELLQELGVGLPQVVKLFLKIKQKYNLDIKVPAKVDEAIELLRKLITEGKLKIKKELSEDTVKNANESSKSTKNQGKPNKEPVLIASNLWYTYPGGVTALKGVSLKLYPGELTALIGQNGSGKSTLALTLAGAYMPTNHDSLIMVNGINIRKMPLQQRIKYVNYVFQNPDNQLFSARVWDEISFALKMIGESADVIKKRTEEALKIFGLENIRKRQIVDLTKDKKTLVAIASVYVLKPKVMIIDEPTGGLDRKSATALMQHLVEMKKQGNSVVIITHDMRLVYEFADRVIVMHDGKILLDGKPGSVFSQFEILKKAFIVPPQISRVAAALHEFGVPPTVYRVDELFNYFEESG
ncbi:MAG: ABC transporter ATP-binding protein [Candidatus Asgardarchaeia archaeon]